MDPEVFLEPLRRGSIADADGNTMPLSSAIFESHALALHRLVRRYKPAAALEIGMAHAISTLAILSALDENGAGSLLSIDPHQSTDWQGAGRAAVEGAGLTSLHEIIEVPDYLALPRLVESGRTFDFAYIDGWHTFDHVVLDAFYIDKTLPVGGIVGFNDCGFPAVRKALGYFTSHRQYRQIDAGLPRNYAASSPVKSVVRRVLGASHEDRYFRKTDDWEPPWDFYQRF